MSSTAAGRRVVPWMIGLLILVVVLYGLRLLWLTMGATEGDVPASSSVSLPSGSTIVSETKRCASGGCWTLMTIEPPNGQSADDLAATLGATPQYQIPGNLWDPRTISAWGESNGRLLELRLDYWSQEWVP